LRPAGANESRSALSRRLARLLQSQWGDPMTIDDAAQILHGVSRARFHDMAHSLQTYQLDGVARRTQLVRK
jgi:hypothetical protein